MNILDFDVQEFIGEMNAEIARRPICEPAEGEFVDECDWSRTGWAIWRHDGPSKYCTCRPALPPQEKDGAAR